LTLSSTRVIFLKTFASLPTGPITSIRRCLSAQSQTGTGWTLRGFRELGASEGAARSKHALQGQRVVLTGSG
jgi:hypothetical protein